MGFNININTILRSDNYASLEVGKSYTFQKDSPSLLADTIQIWLTKKDWTPLAEIMVTSQTRQAEKTTGTFEVMYIYTEAEQEVLKQIFERMYGWVN